MFFLKKIFSPLFLTLSLILLSYIIYKSEIVWSGQRLPFYKFYYIFSFLLIIFSILSFFFNSKIKEYILISLISIFCGLYICEGYFTYKNYQLLKFVSKENDKKIQDLNIGNIDKRSKLKIFEDLKKSDKKIQIVVSPSNHLSSKEKIFPLAGVANSKTIHCNENGYYSIYESDKYGFNNPNKEWSKNEIEYLLLGDSFAHGACVNRPYDIASVLRSLTDKSVINLGFSGTGPLIQFAALKEYFPLNVKNVLWLYYEGNDLIDLSKEKKDPILEKYLIDTSFVQNLKNNQKKINNIVKKSVKKQLLLKKKKSNTKLIKFLKLNALRVKLTIFLSENNQLDINPITDEFVDIIKYSKEFVEKENSKFYFIYLHNYNIENFIHKNSHYKKIKDLMNKLDVPFIDIHKNIYENLNLNEIPGSFKNRYLIGGHHDNNGYEKIANIIYQSTK